LLLFLVDLVQIEPDLLVDPPSNSSKMDVASVGL
jgi:hypothetical protein